MGERGPHRGQLTEEQIDFLQLYYRTKGPNWCAARLGVARNTLRHRLQIWCEEHGEIEFVKPRSKKKEPRRLFGGPIPKQYNSCRRWGDRPERGRSQPMTGGKRIA